MQVRTTLGQVGRVDPIGQVGGVGRVAVAVREAPQRCVVIDLTDRRARRAPAERRPWPASPRATRPAPGLVLTRRGVLVMRLLAGVFAALVLTGGVLGLSLRARADDARRPPAGTVHVVMPGETLWRIARDEAPGVDPREAVRQLAEVNDLSSGEGLAVGRRLFVPEGLGR